MNTYLKAIRRGINGEGGFTMIEIALSIAVVAFALVAIMGILPTGMTVQKDNREDTIMNQEGQYWVEAIRSGARGLDELTNYVEAITFHLPKSKVEITNTAGLFTGEKVIGWLTFLEGIGTNYPGRVTARVRAITGSAAEKGTMTNLPGFRYEIETELFPYNPPLTPIVGVDELVYRKTLVENLHDVRIRLRWPIYERGTDYATGNGRKTFRATVAGTLVETNFPGLPSSLSVTARLLQPNTFSLR